MIVIASACHIHLLTLCNALCRDFDINSLRQLSIISKYSEQLLVSLIKRNYVLILSTFIRT